MLLHGATSSAGDSSLAAHVAVLHPIIPDEYGLSEEAWKCDSILTHFSRSRPTASAWGKGTFCERTELQSKTLTCKGRSDCRTCAKCLGRRMFAFLDGFPVSITCSEVGSIAAHCSPRPGSKEPREKCGLEQMMPGPPHELEGRPTRWLE